MDGFEIFKKFFKTGEDPIPAISKIKLNKQFGNDVVSDKEIAELKKQFYNLQKVKPIAQCLAPVTPRCNEKPIDSHSIQRNGPLKLISHNGHVAMFDSDISNFDEGPQISIKFVGLKKATTFPGLCSTHDNQIFSGIENGSIENPTPEQEFLYAYRSILREVYAKECQYLMAKKTVQNVTDQKSGAYMQKAIIAYAYQVYLGLCDIGKVLHKFEAGYVNGCKTDLINTYSIQVGRRLPFSCSGHFTPKYSMSGRKIRKGNIAKFGLPWMSMSILPQQNSTLITFGWDKKHSKHLRRLIKEIRGCDETSISHFVWELAIRESENIAISPEAWNELQDEDKKKLLNFFRATIFEKWVPWVDVYMKTI